MFRSYSFLSKTSLWNGGKRFSISPQTSTLNVNRNPARLIASTNEFYSRDISPAENSEILQQALKPLNAFIKKRLTAVREEFAPLRNYTVMENFDRMVQLYQMSKNPSEVKNFRQGVKDLLEKQKQDIAKGIPEKRLQAALARAIAGPPQVVDPKKAERLQQYEKEKEQAMQRLDEDIKKFQAEMDLAEKERQHPPLLFNWVPPAHNAHGDHKIASKDSPSHGSH